MNITAVQNFRDYDEVHDDPSFKGFWIIFCKGAAACLIPHAFFYPFDVIRTRRDAGKRIRVYKYPRILFAVIIGFLFFPFYMVYRGIYFSVFFTKISVLERTLGIELTSASFDLTEFGFAFAVAYVSF